MMFLCRRRFLVMDDEGIASRRGDSTQKAAAALKINFLWIA